MSRRVYELYTPKQDGLPSNEDCGQMSAWYVFSAIGFIQFVQVTIMPLALRFQRPLFIRKRKKDFTIEAKQQLYQKYAHQLAN
ncbi:MAG: glycoside hydrolase family 92 protein [Bacteroidetes bacterium]|nr:glycoside hydrolase family 92 protein [Bacteroidota bacterium]